MVSEIKDCPFCGEQASLEHCDGKYWVQCDEIVDCGVTDGCEYDSANEAISRWNRRA